MNASLVNRLESMGLISLEQAAHLRTSGRYVEVGTDLRFWLYAGILLFCSGVGIEVYAHIDTIGHTAIILTLSVITGLLFFYCFRKGGGYHPGKLSPVGWQADYALITACMLFLILVGYIQFQYQIFGQAYDLATFIPMLLLFALAYYFDHLGVLAMAIANLCVWVGITASPTRFWMQADFFQLSTAHVAMGLGLALWLWAYYHERLRIKSHFAFSYQHVAMHLFLIGTAVAMVSMEHNRYILYLIPALAACLFLYVWGSKKPSFYVVVVSILYAYFFVNYAVVRLFLYWRIEGAILPLYFMITAIALLVFLLKSYRKMKAS
jgi:hypothetical protein